MKTLITALNHPLVVLLHSILGAAMVAYLEDLAVKAILWFLPCCFVVMADLVAGIQAAKYRKERVTFSGACRRTINKALCYVAWILACVCLDKQYAASWPSAIGMGFVIFVEGCSFVGNVLEPKGYSLSIRGLLSFIGRRHNAEGLEDVVEKRKGDGTSAI